MKYKLQSAATFCLGVFALTVASSSAHADELATHSIYFYGNCDVELEGNLVMNGECYHRSHTEMGKNVDYFYDQPVIVGGEIKFKHMLVRYETDSDGIVKIAYENGDGIHYLMGDFTFDGDCYVSNRGKVCNHVYEAAD